MTDQDRFESRLEARIRDHVAPAGRDFDAFALTRAAASVHVPRHPWPGRLPIGLTMRPLVLALVGLLLALLGAAGLIAASRWLHQGPPIQVQAPGTFALTGQMSHARYWHTAVRLADGRVLIVGGFPTVPPDGNDPPAPADVLPAEIYDPATGTFSALPALSPANQGSSATLLGDGRVLIAGGRTRATSPHPMCSSACRLSGTALDTAVLFDSRTGTTTPAGPLNVARFGQAAILLDDGRVLIAGGYTGSTIDLGNGSSTMESLSSAEIYDPGTNAFTLTGSMIEPATPDMRVRVTPGTMLLRDGRVLVEGEVFDPSTGGFGLMADAGYATDLSFALGDGRVDTFLVDGRVLWTGGTRYGRANLDLHAQIGDPSTGASWPTGPMIDWRLGHTATLLVDGRVLVAGGVGPSEQTPGAGSSSAYVSLASAELYVPPPWSEALGPPSSSPW
jgi:hypothetical protein